LPESNANKTADNLIKNTSYSLLEVLCIPFWRKKHFAKIISWQGLENIKPNKGAIILSIHAGNYEITPTTLANKGYKINTVLRATEDPVFEIINKSRAKGRVKLINILEDDMYKESIKAIEQNELVFLLADTGALESRHEMVDFLGHKVAAATGWLTLARRTGCPVIPAIAKRDGKKVIMTFYPALEVTKETRERAKKNALEIFENFIKQNPDQWAMFLNEYETRRMVEGK
ncbi:MAG: lysophospholipid acyltransferase family protein, partial [Candidatus Margulisbacteria bacterium]|nr:lysophospholipid acyltransferase family protein [Candidatus Margulisiibacteriota bacterium]